MNKEPAARRGRFFVCCMRQYYALYDTGIADRGPGMLFWVSERLALICASAEADRRGAQWENY